MRVIRARTPGLKAIYNKYLKTQPSLSGIIKVRLTISPSGKIISAKKISSSTEHTEFDSAVMAAVKRRWRFEKIKSGNTTITVPLTFCNS